jgi:hypothetical protein
MSCPSKYYEKYLKYKAKYLELSQKGGGLTDLNPSEYTVYMFHPNKSVPQNILNLLGKTEDIENMNKTMVEALIKLCEEEYLIKGVIKQKLVKEQIVSEKLNSIRYKISDKDIALYKQFRNLKADLEKFKNEKVQMETKIKSQYEAIDKLLENYKDKMNVEYVSTLYKESKVGGGLLDDLDFNIPVEQYLDYDYFKGKQEMTLEKFLKLASKTIDIPNIPFEDIYLFFNKDGKQDFNKSLKYILVEKIHTSGTVMKEYKYNIYPKL